MNTKTCQNCKVSHGPDDMFCENCGYDFITGSLPAEGEPSSRSAGVSGARPAAAGAQSSGAQSSGAPASGGSGPAPTAAPPSVLSEVGDEANPVGGNAPPVADVPRVRLIIAVDRSYFDAVVNDGEIDFPDPIPKDQELELPGAELHIGRTSDSRAIHPDIDVAELTGDQAVSSRHAVLRVANDGTYTIVDVGSTNGTFLDDVESDAVSHGVPISVVAGTPIYVGAWTRLTIAD